MAEDDNTGLGRCKEIEQLVWQQEAEQKQWALPTVSRSHPHPPVAPRAPPQLCESTVDGPGVGFQEPGISLVPVPPSMLKGGISQLEIEGFLFLWELWGTDYGFHLLLTTCCSLQSLSTVLRPEKSKAQVKGGLLKEMVAIPEASRHLRGAWGVRNASRLWAGSCPSR